MKEQHISNGLTICMVYHSPEARALLDMNIAFTARMNPGSDIRWLVADNSPNAPHETRTEGSMTIIKGAPVPVDAPLPLSYHHAAGINLLLPFISTRYALIMDIDFFLVGARWEKAILSHMQEKDIAFFGAPYHPRHRRKYRYFPSVHCIFIDGGQITLSNLDFSPDVEIVSPGRVRQIFRELSKKILKKRYLIRATKDTGFRIYERFHNNSAIHFEYVTSVWNPRRNPIEYILPERLCLVPKRMSSMSAKGFAHFGHTSLAELDGEEFIWNNALFGFHIKKGTTKKMKENTEERMTFLKGLLA